MNETFPFNGMKKLFPVTKTLAFQIIPVGKTRENLNRQQTLENASELKKDYESLKAASDRVHKRFIEDTLSKFHLKYLSDGAKDSIQEYADVFLDATLSPEEKDILIAEVAANLRKQVADAFSAVRYNEKDTMLKALASKALLTEILPAEDLSDTEKASLGRLSQYTTYMRPYFEARDRMYEADQDGHTIPVRIIGDNLPIHLTNVRLFDALPEEVTSGAAKIFSALADRIEAFELRDVFTASFFSMLCPQSAIDTYNTLIGGVSNEDGTRIQGLNELINQYNQKQGKDGKKLKQFKKLKKQILSDRMSLSWLPDTLADDKQAVQVAFGLEDLLAGFTPADSTAWNTAAVHVDAKRLGAYSNAVFGHWKEAESCLLKVYSEAFPKKSREGDKGYAERIGKIFKAAKSFSLDEIHGAVAKYGSLAPDSPAASAPSALRLYYMDKIAAKVTEARVSIGLLHDHVDADGVPDAKLGQDAVSGELGPGAYMKDFLEQFNDAKNAALVFTDLGGILDTDQDFYGRVVDFFGDVSRGLKAGYDTIRNYLTKKPYSTDKIQLYFDNPKLLDGWDTNKEPDNRGVILRDGDDIFLGILPAHAKRLFTYGKHLDPASSLKKMDVKFIPNPHMMLPKVAFSKKALSEGNIPEPVMDLYRSGKAVKDYTKEEVALMVDFYKGVIASNPDWGVFGFQFKEAADYERLADFYHDVASQGYKTVFYGVSRDFIDKAVAEGDLFLFQVSCQDMLERHTGKDGNYKALLYEALSGKIGGDVRLCGGGAVYFRPASLPRKVTHPAGVPIRTKNPDSEREKVTYVYDLIKDRRYTEDRYAFHIPVSIYPDADAYGALSVNRRVQEIVRETPGVYVLGINRGERNLISIAVTAPDGTIVEQRNLNVFDNFDYRRKLAEREKERTENRRNWTSVKDIKNIKAGYLTRVVGEIVRLVKKYGCVIAMERLDMDFKTGRQAFEKNVYEQFERDLVSRLSFLADKNEADRFGTVLQLANPGKTEIERTRFPQNGILFLMNPAHVSKTDPLTGFVNRLNLHFGKIAEAEAIIDRFDGFRFNPQSGRFVLTFHYDKAAPEKEAGDGKKAWNIETYGERVEQEQVEDAPAGTYADKVTVLTDAMQKLLDGAGIDWKDGKDLLAGLKGRGTEFYKSFFDLLRLTMRCTNWYNDTREFRIVGCTANAAGQFYDSRRAPERLPKDGDTLAAWNIARKAHIVLKNIRDFKPGVTTGADGKKAKGPRTVVSDADWFAEIQK